MTTDPTGPRQRISTLQPTTAAAQTMKVISDQLEEERATKTSLESRATSVITTSGTLTTLLFALAAVVTQKDSFDLPTPAKVLLVAATACFMGAVILALLVARPTNYKEMDEASLRAIASAEALAASAVEAEPVIATAQVEIILGARSKNGGKANLLGYAVLVEVLATVLVGAAVVAILLAS